MTKPQVSRRRRARPLALLLLAGALGWLIYTAIRTRVLLANGRAIEAHSATFPRDYFVGDSGAPALTYLVMGDSTAAGWGAPTVKTSYPYLVAQAVAARGFRVHVVNVAVGGATLNDVLQHQRAQLAASRPDLVTLSVGANDATHFTAPDAFARDLRILVAALQKSSARAILVANTPELFLAPALPLPLAWAAGRRARAQNQAFDSVLKNTRLHSVDLQGRGQLDSRINPDFYAADWFHPSQAGYAKWARLFAEAWPLL